MKLKELLKSKGWSDQQIAAAFADQGTLNVLEEMFGSVVTERDTLKARDEEWERKLKDEFNPAITKAEQQAIEARRRAADLETQVQLAKEYGYLPEDEAARKAAEVAEAAKRSAGNGSEGYDPKKHPTWEDVNRFADAEGAAIAMAQDLAAEYSYLTGGSLFDYETSINGRQMRGLSALREEAKAARKNLDLYIGEKFDFAGKRRAKVEARQKEHDDRIAKETEERVTRQLAEKYGNPNLAMPAPSRQPFMPAKRADGKQPWDVPQQERRADRLKRHMETQMRGERVQ